MLEIYSKLSNFSQMRKNGIKIQFLLDDHYSFDRLKCEHCKEIMIEPCQTRCGYRFCYSCTVYSVDETRQCCLKCEEPISFKSNAIFDKATEKEILNLQMKCVNVGCTEIITFKDLNHHLDICEYRKEKCVKCGEVYVLKEANAHINHICIKTIISCEDCGIKMSREQLLDTHRNINYNSWNDLCENWSYYCPFSCQQEPFRSIKFHLSECPKQPISCEMKIIGCKAIVPREDMSKHIINDAVNHFSLMIKATKKCREFEKSPNLCLKEESTELNSRIQKYEMEINELRKKCHEQEKQLEELVKNFEQIPSNVSTSSIKTHISNEFVWEIKEIRRKLEAAKVGSTIQILSDEFYVSKPGYKMRLKAYPNGDGVAKDKYFSLFFVIMKGEYDNVMPWPFRNKVTLSLNSDSLSISLKPDNNRLCYGKPVNKFNVAAGQPEFVKLDDLMSSNKYLYGDTLSVKIIVHKHPL